ncbi:ferrous iron transport protein B [Desulfoluna spongiiphila]|uniref:ferrous iron transport protein B n=1 Tax=Desulfoluna spongiiphila TaxID=419481 RepID=UPI0012546F6C|nr:ferrous iron transport protein B [Desulfoluna spongiiphila]VVS94560.1 ferrous iron transport protein b [Desulfoluna spongiiphila]
MSNIAAAANEPVFTVAVAGQPNTGKSTLFNTLTGSSQHVGNWPGKTVEKKSGIFETDHAVYNVVDLPGTYSLSANSQEELIAREFIVEQRPDLIVVVVDASQLERSFYMAAEVMAMRVPVLIALNMMDVAEAQGKRIDVGHMEAALGVRVVPMTASRQEGVADLIEAIEAGSTRGDAMETGTWGIDGALRDTFGEVKGQVADHLPDGYHPDWVVLKLLEHDAKLGGVMEKAMGADRWGAVRDRMATGMSGLTAVAEARYDWVLKRLHGCVTTLEANDGRPGRGRFDRFATHPVWGALFSVGVILVGFFLAACIGFSCVGLLQPVTTASIGAVEAAFAGALPVLCDMITQGVIPGVFMVFCMSSFVFGILVLIGFLEDIGYLPRMAYVADILMNRIGLHGKSFMPLFMGFGCNIAAVMGTRVIDSSRQRFLTIFLSSLIPCPGVMVTCAFIVTIFFGHVASLVVVAMGGALLLQLLLTSLLVGRTVLPGTSTGMVMELPPYHRPNAKTIWSYAWLHYKGYLKKGGTLIAAIILMVWALSYFPTGNMNDSYLAAMGKALEPLGQLMGMDWKLLTCLCVAFFSKEAALAAMGVIYGLHASDGSLMSVVMESIAQGQLASHTQLADFLAVSISRPSALAFVFAILFSIPCYSTVGVIYFETKSMKWTVGTVAYYSLLSFVWGVLAYRVGLLLF